jgi:hypothetical protein
VGNQIRVVNLEQGLPTREEACKRLEQALQQARKAGVPALKLIHGYGSTGAGGILRFAVRNYLRQRKEAGELRAFIPGESWSQFERYSKELLQRVPESLLDSDLGRANKGITLVLL